MLSWLISGAAVDPVISSNWSFPKCCGRQVWVRPSNSWFLGMWLMESGSFQRWEFQNDHFGSMWVLKCNDKSREEVRWGKEKKNRKKGRGGEGKEKRKKGIDRLGHVKMEAEIGVMLSVEKYQGFLATIRCWRRGLGWISDFWLPELWEKECVLF